MEREFTNALASIPLWSFAIRVYPEFKSTLLGWQDDQSASVNDLLTLAFAKQHSLMLPSFWWQQARIQQNRQLIARVRCLRKQPKPLTREQLLDLELRLEAIDIQLLSGLLSKGDTLRNEAQYAEHLGVSTSAISQFTSELAQYDNATP